MRLRLSLLHACFHLVLSRLEFLLAFCLQYGYKFRFRGAITHNRIDASIAISRCPGACCSPRHQSVFQLLYRLKLPAVDDPSVSVLLVRRKSKQRGDAVILAGYSDAGKTAILSTVSEADLCLFSCSNTSSARLQANTSYKYFHADQCCPRSASFNSPNASSDRRSWASSH